MKRSESGTWTIQPRASGLLDRLSSVGLGAFALRSALGIRAALGTQRPGRAPDRGVGLGLLAGLCVLLGAAPILRAATLKVGDSFPKLADYNLEGTLPALEGKVVLVDFWASWCAPCKRSFPVMKELQDKFAARGFVIVAVSVDEKKAAMDAFLAKNPIPFAVVRDPKGKLPEAAGVEKMPTSFLLAPDGKVVAIHSGFAGDTTRAEYLSQIEAALKAAGR